MRATLEHINPQEGGSPIICYGLNVSRFEFYWHHHPEYELTYILQGTGKRLVGDNIEQFEAGDLVLLGPHLPHTWVSDATKKQTCRALVLQFAPSFSDPLMQYPEMAELKKLLDAAQSGLHIQLKKQKQVGEMMERLQSQGVCIRWHTLFSYLPFCCPGNPAGLPLQDTV